MNKRKNIFYMVFSLWYFGDIILRTTFEEKINEYIDGFFHVNNFNINKTLDFLVLALLIVQILFFQKYATHEIIIIFSISLPIVASAILSDSNYLVSLMLFVVASKNASMEKIIKIAYFILCITIPFIIIMCLIGTIPDFTMYRHSLLRHSLGFEHPNRLGMRMFQFAACHCYLFRDKARKFITYAILIILIIFVYRVPNSQTGYIGLSLLFLLFAQYQIINKYSLDKNITMIVYYFASVLIYFGTAILCFFNPTNNYFFNMIDKFLSRRFLWCYKMYKYYGATFLGQKISTWVQDRRYIGIYRQWYLDNAYFSILLSYGIIIFFVFGIIFLASIKHYVKKQNFMMVAILFVYTIYGIMTTGFYMMSHNIFLLAISSAIYVKHENVDGVKQMRRVLIRW